MSEPITWTNVRLKLSDLKKWDNNPAEITKEAAGRLVECFNEFGQIETLAVDPENRLVDGHQRLDTWLAKYGDIEVDCRKASRLLTEKERQKIAVMLRSGAVGRYNWDVVSSWDADDLQGWGMDSATLKDWKRDITALDLLIGSEAMLGVEKGTKPNKRKLPLDMIYTAGSIGKNAIEDPCTTLTHCCIAVRSGLLYGVQSTGSGGVCATALHQKAHLPQFIDNDFYNYEHEIHLASVAKWKPKYCTVRDVMTEEQCKEAGIIYYPLEQILDWAEELQEHAENVIVIPKYDCLNKIPEKFMLGYSVPTSHGGTPLPVKMFLGRRVHLLGGSWKMQLAHMAELGDDVISVDNNYINKMSQYGSFVYPDGSRTSQRRLGSY